MASPARSASRARSAGQPVVGGQPFAHHPGGETAHLVNDVPVLRVVLARVLVDIALQMLLRELVEHLLVAALHHRSEGFATVGVRLLPDIAPDRMAHRLMRAPVLLTKPDIGRILVGVDRRPVRCVFPDEALQRLCFRVRHHLDDNLPSFAVPGGRDDQLAYSSASEAQLLT